MYVTPVEYLELTENSSKIRNRCQELQQINQQLQEKCNQLYQRIQFLEKKNQELEAKQKQTEEQLIRHISSEAGEVQTHMSVLAEQQRKFIAEQMIRFSQDANVRKIKQLQKKMTENRIKNHEMVDFYEKVKKCYQAWTKSKKQPSAADLYKWVNDKKVDMDNQNTDLVKGILESVIDKKANNKSKGSLNVSTISNQKRTSIFKLGEPPLQNLKKKSANQAKNNQKPPATVTKKNTKGKSNKQQLVIKNANSSTERNLIESQDINMIDNSSFCQRPPGIIQNSASNILDDNFEIIEPQKMPRYENQSNVHVKMF